MPYLTLKVVPFLDGESEVNYRHVLLNTLVESPVDQTGRPIGIAAADIERIKRVVDTLRPLADTGTLVLDDEDWKFVQTRLDQVRWARFDEAIYDFMQAVHNPVAGLPESHVEVEAEPTPAEPTPAEPTPEGNG